MTILPNGPPWTGSEAGYRAAIPDRGCGLRAGLLGWSPGRRSGLRGGRRAGDRVRIHAERKCPHQGHFRKSPDLAGLRSVERLSPRALRARSFAHFPADPPGGIRERRHLGWRPVGRRPIAYRDGLLRELPLVEGRDPSSPDEVLVPQALAAALSIAPGDRISLSHNRTTGATVSGIYWSARGTDPLVYARHRLLSNQSRAPLLTTSAGFDALTRSFGQTNDIAVEWDAEPSFAGLTSAGLRALAHRAGTGERTNPRNPWRHHGFLRPQLAPAWSRAGGSPRACADLRDCGRGRSGGPGRAARHRLPEARASVVRACGPRDARGSHDRARVHPGGGSGHRRESGAASFAPHGRRARVPCSRCARSGAAGNAVSDRPDRPSRPACARRRGSWRRGSRGRFAPAASPHGPSRSADGSPGASTAYGRGCLTSSCRCSWAPPR